MLGTEPKIKNIYDFKIPQPPKETNNKANWAYMTWMWFFEQGKNKIRFSSNSLESQDIANSYSMKELKKEYFKTGKIPKLWQFTGPGTATGNYGEVEWFLGSYTIKDFKLENGIATFTVYNKSGWRSGTRLPKSWSDKIKDMTVEEFFDSFIDLVSSKKNKETVKEKLYQCIYNKDGVDYKTLYKLLPSLDEDDLSLLLRYDKDYKVSFLLAVAEFADEEDLTKQAIFLLRRYNLNYIIPLLPYVDEDIIREEYSQIKH